MTNQPTQDPEEDTFGLISSVSGRFVPDTQDPLLFTSDPGENGSDTASTVEYTKETNVSVPTPATDSVDGQLTTVSIYDERVAKGGTPPTPATKPLDELDDKLHDLLIEYVGAYESFDELPEATTNAEQALKALITNAEKQARIEELKWAHSQESYPIYVNIENRIQELENL